MRACGAKVTLIGNSRPSSNCDKSGSTNTEENQSVLERFWLNSPTCDTK
ncbi:Uncharacterised protein [Vibrio cholerae]|nr:Uncharacterised protein [Vibrio cholerae]